MNAMTRHDKGLPRVRWNTLCGHRYPFSLFPLKFCSALASCPDEMGHRLLFAPRSALLKPAFSKPPCFCQATKSYGKYKEEDDDEEDRAIGEKGRSTAEEFSRVAKAKAAAAKRSQIADAGLEGLRDSDYEKAKKQFKETKDKGDQEKTSKE